MLTSLIGDGVSVVQVRKRVNALDNLMTSKAVDALINYETVKLFTNEGLEVRHHLGPIWPQQSIF